MVYLQSRRSSNTLATAETKELSFSFSVLDCLKSPTFPHSLLCKQPTVHEEQTGPGFSHNKPHKLWIFSSKSRLCKIQLYNVEYTDHISLGKSSTAARISHAIIASHPVSSLEWIFSLSSKRPFPFPIYCYTDTSIWNYNELQTMEKGWYLFCNCRLSVLAEV